jgi:gliding motility-associated-like protein
MATHAQVNIDQNFTIEEYVNNVLLGDGVTASNITLIGDPIQLAKMTDESGNFSVAEGLVLSCGDPNRLSDCGEDQWPTALGDAFDDEDLLDVANSVPPLIGQGFTVSAVNDGCVLEFDFEAGGDSISFNYVFGSDEYLTFVNTPYNDIFAFFLSGPGIAGTYDSPAGFPDGAINIAQIPDSDPVLPITISSVNDVTNTEYYIDNPNQEGICINGYTTTFTASAEVQCGETYHIKLAIADGTDSQLESIVVLEAGSFASSGLDLNANAVPLAADGLEDIVPYEESVGLPEVFSYPNGLSFPYDAWNADNNVPIQLDGQSLVVDAVVIEGCNDAQFTVIRPELGSDVQDTLYLDLAGSALLGDDFSDTFNEVVMAPNQTERSVTLGVKDDGVEEGVEFVEISFEYVNGCGETIVTSSRVAILDAIPVVANPSPVGCLQPDGQQLLGYDDITGYGPFNFIWDGVEWNNAEWGSDAWVTSIDSLFDMTNDYGNLVPSHNIELTVIDQCGKEHLFEQLVLHPVMLDADICFEDLLDYPMFNPSIPIADLLNYNGTSLLGNNNPLGDTLTINASQEGDFWRLYGIESGLLGSPGIQLTIVDTCGYETSGKIVVEDCDVVNVISPNGDNKNDKFQIRGLNGMMGSRLVVFNRYGSVVWEGETKSDEEYELVWNGRHANGNYVAAGTYQWVLTKADGNGTVERGQLTVFSGEN